MNFSELFRQSNQLCKFSPDGKYLWSADSQFILCGLFKRGIVQVWSLEQPDWNCKIDEGSAGLCSVCWGPDGRHILTTADFYLRVTVWSLITKSVSYIRYPKQCQKNLDFSNGGKYMALAERRDCKDYISIFTCSTWELVKHFETDTDDLTGIEWSPDGRVLGVWECPLTYKVLLYSVDGRCIAKYSAYDNALGVKSIAWSPTSQFLALGSYDEKPACNCNTFFLLGIRNLDDFFKKNNIRFFNKTVDFMIWQTKKFTKKLFNNFQKRLKYPK
ncbi:hypothetical protein KUTeg_001881 [Tegillarca granosa]|uniref:Uncharacterized protein n=1 Tax=Tegillarca granosa TaxID=220873 RepID=A0ABQ9FSQ8_TEGGR|nr:hypothetical protein KUTeg_001881 [Tegillarca granosa]